MSEIKPYVEYQSSGIDWLGDIPTSWEVIPSKAAFQLRNESELPGDVHLTPSQKYGVMSQQDYMAMTGAKVVLTLVGTTKMRHVEVNDFIIHLRSFQGGIEWSGISGKVSPAYTVLSPSPRANPSYFRYVLKSRGYIEKIASLTDQLRDGQSMKYSEFGKAYLPLPPAADQCAIAEYLDHETAEIDAFIADQGELIALLNERRTATITQAISHGLNMGAPMGESGYEVVPPFPTHWVREKLSRLGLTMTSGTSVNGYSDPEDLLGVRVLKTGCASKGYFDPSENKRVIEEDLHRVSCPVMSGSLIVNRANTPELVGSCALVTESYEDLYLSDKLWQLDFDNADNRFIYWWMKTPSYRSQIRFYAVGASATMQNLSFADFRSFAIALPPLSEQAEIADYLDFETAEIDAAIADAKKAIELSKERRAALISAAVTGKIDVRNHITAELGAA